MGLDVRHPGPGCLCCAGTDALRAEVERLMKERDEALKRAKKAELARDEIFALHDEAEAQEFIRRMEAGEYDGMTTPLGKMIIGLSKTKKELQEKLKKNHESLLEIERLVSAAANDGDGMEDFSSYVLYLLAEELKRTVE